MIFNIEEGNTVRIERSVALNGHFYMRLRNNQEKEFTLGFGYDEPYHNPNPLLSNPISTFVQMAYTILEPIENKWVKYLNDYPRNPTYIPNKYHICTNWINISKDTSIILNNIISGELYYDYFKSSFSPVVFENSKNNCRTILFLLLKESLSREQLHYINTFTVGNPLWNDVRYGCLQFNIIDTKANISISHPCGNSTQSCCKSVIKDKHCTRIPMYK